VSDHNRSKPVDAITLRESGPGDVERLLALYPKAFPQEDLLALVRGLLAAGPAVLSLVAMRDSRLVGHAAFTRCGVLGSAERVALLGPLAVTPEFQRQGIGGALIREGLRRLAAEGTALVLVLGDPAYYGRFGFAADADILPPYALPAEWRTAWQLVGLKEGKPRLRGRLELPPLWLQPALWAP